MFLKTTPWDSELFGFPTYELTSFSKEALESMRDVKGHITAKVKGLQDNSFLHQYGFYYCGTLITPFCSTSGFKECELDAAPSKLRVAPMRPNEQKELQEIYKSAFIHGRFHRDPNIPKEKANERYIQWFNQISHTGNVLTFFCEEELAGFFAYNGDSILLHALGEKFRGRGLAKYFWSAACKKLFSENHHEIHSSISTDNLAILNLYVSLGFRFRDPYHCFHRFIPTL